MPLFGAPNVQKLKERRDIHGLVKALASKDSNARREAAIALYSLMPKVVAPKSLTDSEILELSHALERLCDVRIVEALTAALREENSNVRSEVVKAFGMLCDPQAADLLTRSLVNPAVELATETTVNRATLRALAKMGYWNLNTFLDGLRDDGVRSRMRKDMKKGLEMRMRAALEAQYGRATRDIRVAPQPDDKAPHGALYRLINARSASARAAEARDLVQKRRLDREVILDLSDDIFLLAIVGVWKELVIEPLGRAIARLRATNVDVLIPFLADSDLDVREAAATALERIGGQEAERTLGEYHARQN